MGGCSELKKREALTLAAFRIIYVKECPRAASHSFSAAPGEVCVQGRDVVVICGILGGASAGQLELLGSVGELEGSIRVGRVRQQGALPLQHVGHPFKQVQETKG